MIIGRRRNAHARCPGRCSAHTGREPSLGRRWHLQDTLRFVTGSYLLDCIRYVRRLRAVARPTRAPGDGLADCRCCNLCGSHRVLIQAVKMLANALRAALIHMK